MTVDGTYSIIVNSPLGKQNSTLILKTDGEKLTGTADSPLGKGNFTGTVKGSDLAWSVDVTTPMGAMKLEFKASVSGPDISGHVKAGVLGAFQFCGKKV